MPPVNQMVPIGAVPRQQPWFPTNLLHCRELRPGAARPRGRSRHHLPAGISLHQRHHQVAARQFRRPAARERGHAGPRQRRSRRRYRLQRRHAAVELQGRRPPRARHRADRRRRHRQRARHPDAQALFRRRGRRARSSASTAPARVVTAANCFAHIEDVHAIVDGIVEMLDAGRRVHLRVALPHRRCSTRCNTTRSITSTCAIIRWPA